MIYLLDTSAISLLMQEDVALRSWLVSISSPDQVVTCTVSQGEILFGLARLPPGKRRAELETKAAALFAALSCVGVIPPVAAVYARVKAMQQMCGFSLDENDLWIAATALELGATLVTRDTDFRRVEALPVFVP